MMFKNILTLFMLSFLFSFYLIGCNGNKDELHYTGTWCVSSRKNLNDTAKNSDLENMLILSLGLKFIINDNSIKIKQSSDSTNKFGLNIEEYAIQYEVVSKTSEEVTISLLDDKTGKKGVWVISQTEEGLKLNMVDLQVYGLVSCSE